MVAPIILIFFSNLIQASVFVNYWSFKPNLMFVSLLTLTFFERDAKRFCLLVLLAALLLKFPNAFASWSYITTLALPIFFFYLRKLFPLNLYFSLASGIILGTALINLGLTPEILYNLPIGFLVFLYLNWSYEQVLA